MDRWPDLNNLPHTSNRLAYVFYATNQAYAIAVMVMVRMLQRLGIRNDADLIVLHLPLARSILTKMREMGLTTVRVPVLPYIDYPYFKDCLIKLRILQLIEYDRLLFVDADSIPLKSLDNLLQFPFGGPIAAPRAYWLPQPFWTSALLVVRPSAANWDRVTRHFASAASKHFYDMEIVNVEFASELATLPADAFALNSEWEDANRSGFFGNFDDTYAKVSVVHFTALGKPWFYSLEEVRRLRPNAHPVFYTLWEAWHKTREEVL